MHVDRIDSSKQGCDSIESVHFLGLILGTSFHFNSDKNGICTGQTTKADGGFVEDGLKQPLGRRMITMTFRRGLSPRDLSLHI